MTETHHYLSPRAIVDLLPRFLQRRRRGFGGLATILAAGGLSRPALFLLLAVTREPPAGATPEALRPGAPYATRDPHLPLLDDLLAGEYVALDAAGRYRPTARGLALAARVEREATAYLATLAPLPPADLARLADRLATIAAGLDAAAGGPAAHLQRGRRVAALAPEASAAPLVRLERAAYDLWMARDDAHIGAWRLARFHGPALDVLTRLTRGEAETPAALRDLLAATQAPADVDAAVDELVEQGYVVWRGDTLQPTRAGYAIRESIEADTDELYFRQWPPLAPAEVAWLRDALAHVIAGLDGGGDRA
ncbi:MAG TPA: hypothetical protein VFW96_03165 [Thermomicrobiales bacterium]|nr:hypothetical protein [Thermomicrobiales bacterium]